MQAGEGSDKGMTERDQMEELSALVDGELAELPARRLADRLVDDDELRERWGRYHLIGAVMRDEYKAGAGVAAKVENTLATGVVDRVMVEARPRRGLRPLTGFAVAASVAALALVSVRWFTEVDAPVNAPVARVIAPSGGVGALPAMGRQANGGVQTLPARAPSAQLRLVDGKKAPSPPPLDQMPELAPDAKLRLNRYLLDHAQSTRSGVRATFPYAALVGYEAR